MKMFMLILALSPSLMAQNFNGVSIGGTPQEPTIVNHSWKAIMGYALNPNNGARIKVIFDDSWIANNELIAPGEERSALGLAGSFHRGSLAEARYTLFAVLFADGTVIGTEAVLRDFSNKIALSRSIARDMQYQQDKYTVMAADRKELFQGNRLNHRMLMSHTLLTIKETSGEAEAEAAISRLASIPDVTVEKKGFER